MSFFRTYLSASLGSLGFKDIFTDVNMTYKQILSVGGGFPGETCPLFGNLYQLVQNRSGGALAVGDAVSLLLGDANRTGNLTAASTTSILTTDDTLDSNLAGNQDYPGYVAVTAGALATTADEALRRILNNSTDTGASTITVAVADFSDGTTNGAASNSPDVITTPGATYDYEVFCPWEVVKTDVDAVATCIMQGVVRSTSITDDQFGIIQISGVGLAKVDGTTDVGAGDLLIPDSASGILSKGTLGTNDAYACARILNPYTNNGVGLRLVQFLNNPLFPRPVSF